MNMLEVLVFPIEIKGQALKQRRKLLEKDIDAASKKYYKDVTVSRGRFLEDLFKLAEKNLNYNFSIKFTG